MIDWDDDGAKGDNPEEEMLELTDIVMDEPEAVANDDIIDLTDIVNNEGMDLNLDIEKVETETEIEDETKIEDFDTDFDLEETVIPSPAADIDNKVQSDFSGLTSEQIEAALEKVIEKQFSGKIQTILFEVMEKVIEREIAGIRESLQKDLEQIGNV